MIMVSGGFDYLHDGHLDYLEAANKYGKVIVALNSDQWLIRKKGYCILPWLVRARILNALTMVYEVTLVNDDNGTVSEALKHHRPIYFANGGDRKNSNSIEHKVCQELDITELFGLGGGKIRSSSDIEEIIK